MTLTLTPEDGGPVCICGHPASEHFSETNTERYLGLFNPALAGKVEEYVYLYCSHLDEFTGEPCSSFRHGWSVG